jgi:hypothetical protein
MDLKDALLAIIGGLVGAAFAEFQSWAPRLAERLVLFAARWVPTELRQRLHEEWLGHLAEIPGPLSKLFVALGCGLAAVRVRADHSKPNAVRVVDMVLGGLPLLVYAPVMGFVALGLRIEGRRGPFFQKTELPGADGKPITVRTFPLNVVSTVEGGHQLRPFSGLVARLRLDELPTLFNVVRGEMSFFGPSVWGCGCACCRRGREAAAKPGYVTFERVEHLAREVLGVESPRASSAVRRYLRCLMLLMRLAVSRNPRRFG